MVGGELLRVLIGAPEFSRIIAVSRRPLSIDSPRLANRIVQFENLEAQLKATSCTDALCCLGSTIAAAGSEQAFKAVDLGLVLAFARAAKAAQAQRFVVVSSIGADIRAKAFYLRVKGEMEMELLKLGFAALDILQPGLLLGARRELRPLELAARAFMPLLNPLLLGKYAQYRSISASNVALAMLGATRGGRRGLHRYQYTALRSLAAHASERD
jgi:uncharacterized protein YbjT (DUF2867 family)